MRELVIVLRWERILESVHERSVLDDLTRQGWSSLTALVSREAIIVTVRVVYKQGESVLAI